MKKKRICLLSLVGALFFAICTFFGAVYDSFGDTPGTLESSQFGSYLVLIVGLTFIYYKILCLLLQHDYSAPAAIEESRAAAFFSRHTFIISFFVLLAAWVPYICISFPGTVSFDACRQLEMVTGVRRMSNTHPVTSTLLLGLLFRLGRGVSDDFGVFTVVLAQEFLAAAIFSLCVRKILSLTGRVRWAVAALAFFALDPLWGVYEQAVLKDPSFTSLFALYSVTYVEVAGQVLVKSAEGKVSWKTCGLLMASGVLCCLMRHGELIVIGLSLGLLALLALRDRKKLLLLLAVTVVLSYGSKKVIVSVTHAGPAPTRATFSIFFQQTALYLQRYPEDVTPEQLDAIDAVLDADEIGGLYNPLISDPVKNTYTKAGKRKLAAYFKVWLEMFFRHPGPYFDSFFQFSIGYFDPFHLTSTTIKRPFIISLLKSETINGIELHHTSPPELQMKLKAYLEHFINVPILQQFVFPGTYAWACIACFLLLWYKRCFRQMAVFSLPFLRLLMCVASPVSGFIRYTLPLFAITPLMIAWACAAAGAADKTANKG